MLVAVECLLDKPPSIIVSGLCSSASAFDGFYQAKSENNTGRWYYENENGRFIYFDPMCDGSTLYNRWIFDSTEPSTTAVNDLDGEFRINAALLLFYTNLPLNLQATAYATTLAVLPRPL